MRPAGRIDAYRPVTDPVEAYLYGGDGRQPGDPVKAAEAMIAAVESDDPPLHLLLGQDAIGLWEQKQADFSTESRAGRRSARRPPSGAPQGADWRLKAWRPAYLERPWSGATPAPRLSHTDHNRAPTLAQDAPTLA